MLDQRAVSVRSMKMVAGNAMHMGVVSLWMLYMLSQTVVLPVGGELRFFSDTATSEVDDDDL